MSDKNMQVARKIEREYHINIERVAAILAEEYPEQGWISVSERLPKNGEMVLTMEDGAITMNYIPFKTSIQKETPRRFASGNDFVTHWMPLPSPPARKGESHG